MPKKRRALPIVLAAAFAAFPANAQSVPADRQAAILARALAYDRNLEARAGDAVVVAVVFKPGDGPSQKAAGEAFAAFKALEKLKISGRPFRVVQVAFQSPASITDAVQRSGADVLFLCPGLGADLAAITSTSRQVKITTMSSEEAYVVGGAALGLTVEDGKPKMLINITASREEGALFSSDLIRLARVIR